MTSYEQGEVVLVRFAFTDEAGAKRRPAVIVSIGDYHHDRQEAIIAAITSNVDRLLVGDNLIAGWQEAGDGGDHRPGGGGGLLPELVCAHP